MFAACALASTAAPAAALARAADIPVSTHPSRHPAVRGALVVPNLFGTLALAAPADRTAARWQKAIAAPSGGAIVDLVEPVLGLERSRQLLFVQLAVQRTLAFRDDRQLWGEEDYWATAAETMARGGGDCEDLAIVKYQALRELGFAPEELALSVGRDSVSGDHALLLVRLDDRWWVLDNLRPRPLSPEQRTGFEPVMTLSGADAQWLHGHAYASGGPAPQATARR